MLGRPARLELSLTAPGSAGLDLAEFIRPGDTVLWGQGTAEPRTLTEALVEQRAALGGISVFLGATFSETLRPEHAGHIRFFGIGGIGTNAVLARAGVLDVLPCHISAVPRLIESGRIRVDVVLAQLSPAGPDGRHSMGLVGDYLGTAIARARTVVAEVNQRVPRTLGEAWVQPERLARVLHTSREPVYLPTRAPAPPERRIGALVAALVPDRAVVQLGVGSVFGAVGEALAGHRDLGVHAGVVGDWVVHLTAGGAVTNAFKAVDRGLTVTGALFGSRALYDFAHENPAFHLRPLTHTHDPAVLARLDRLFAVNSAVEVDLTGQVNAETVGGRHVGAVGGQVDFVRAAMASAGGRSIIALPATARNGQLSRIVPRLSDAVVTTPRSDADLFVTEHGVADIRGLPLRERARRLIAIADPAFQGELERAVAGLC